MPLALSSPAPNTRLDNIRLTSLEYIFVNILVKGFIMSGILKGRVLVVDDMGTMVRIIKRFLVETGFSLIDTAENGEEALELIKQNEYVLIISDWNMENMTGLELLKHVREKLFLSTPFIMVTAESKPNNVLAAKAAGVSNYIIKPFTQITLQKKIEKTIGSLD